MTATAPGIAGARFLALPAIGVIAMVAALLSVDPRLTTGLLITGGILLAVGLLQAALALLRRLRLSLLKTAVRALDPDDGHPVYLADAQGRVILQVPASDDGRPVASVQAALAHLLASPDVTVARMADRADLTGRAQEDLVSRRGPLRLSVTRLSSGTYLWRLSDKTDRPPGRTGDGLSLPMLTAGPSGTILYMNDAFRRLVGERARTLDAVFADLPLASGQLHHVTTPAGQVAACVAEVAGTGGRREIYLLPAGDAAAARGTAWELVEDLPVPMLKIAPDGLVLAANREARALLPMQIGAETRLSDLLEGLGRAISDWVREIAEGRHSAAQFLRGTGQYQDLFLRVALSPGTSDGAPHVVAVLNDVTELKSLEAQFVQSQKMQAIGQLAGGIAHDFNNLLTAISGHCDLLLLRHDTADPDYPDLIQIHQNANRAASLVGQLLAYSRKQSLMPEVIDLRDTLSDLTHLLNRLVGEKVRLTLDHDPSLHRIRADKRQLEQVIMNLVVNARDAMPAGGAIRIETGNVHLGEPLERDRATLPAGDFVVVRVIDHGIGIPPERLTKIFEPFYTTKRPGEGTGLGLSTAYGIVKQTGGYIFVDSTVNEGTEFSLYFPASTELPKPSVASPAAEPATLAAPRKGGGTILLVEDEAPVRAFASRALRLRGYSVIEADSAETALSLLADPRIAVDVFVTDVIMPGKDGPTWVREALRDRPDTRVVFVSGYAEEAFAEQKALIPHSVFLPKPFSLTELTATVQRQLA